MFEQPPEDFLSALFASRQAADHPPYGYPAQPIENSGSSDAPQPSYDFEDRYSFAHNQACDEAHLAQ